MGLGERIGQREQPRFLLVEDVGDALIGPSRMRSLVCDGREEFGELGVTVRGGMERPRSCCRAH